MARPRNAARAASRPSASPLRRGPPHQPTRAERPSRSARPIGLAGLRGFEASGRLLSFTLAAVELNLTQSSISRQVATLERQIGRPLFMRRTRALQLTPAGLELLRAVQQGLRQIDQTIDEVRGRSRARRVTVTSFASFASLWLVPRLPYFQRSYPDIEIRIDAGDRLIDLEAEDVDLAIRLTRPAALPSTAIPLLEEHATPALSPLLVERLGSALAQPSDLLALPLLGLDISTAVAPTWAQWFAYAGVRAAPPPPRLMFTFVDQAMQAAVRGQGVVLGRSPFVDDLVASGDLIAPFAKQRMSTGARFALLSNTRTGDAPHVAAFREWIVAEFRQGPRRNT